MVRLKKILSIILEALALIGLIAGLVFTFQYARANFLPPSGSNVKDVAAYPPPVATQVYTPFPTYTPIPIRTPTPTPIVLDNGWYLYVDKEAGYSFSYPPDAFFQTSKEGAFDYKTVHLQFHMPDANGYQGMLIEILSNPQKRPIESIAQEIYTTGLLNPSLDDVKKNVEQIKVAGISAYKFTFKPFFYELTILLPYRGKVYFIVPVHDNLDIANDPKALELFFKILETFTLNPLPDIQGTLP